MVRVGVTAAVVVVTASLVAVAPAAQSPKMLLASILTKARAQHSVHYLSRQSMGAAGRLTIHADVARSRGVQHVTDTNGKKSVSVEILVVADTAYVRGAAGGLEDLVGLRRAKAARYAGRWISIPADDKLYRRVATAVTLRSFLRYMAPPPHSRFKAVSATIKGTKAIEIRATSKSGELDLAVRRTGHLPIEATQVAAGGMTQTAMSHWNETVQVRAPANAVPIATVRR